MPHSMAQLLLLRCPQRPNWPPSDWRILVGDGLLGSPILADIPSLAGYCRLKFQEIWDRFLGGKKTINSAGDLCYYQDYAVWLVVHCRLGLERLTIRQP